MSNILKYGNNDDMHLNKCSKCQKHYRWICVYCFCKSKFNIKILNKIFSFDLKDIDTYLYNYLNNDKNNVRKKPSKIQQNLSIVQTKMIYNLEKDLVRDIVENSYKIDYEGNVMMREVITKFFKQQHYNKVFKKMRSIVCYHDFLGNGILYYQKIYQVYMVHTSESEKSIQSVKEEKMSDKEQKVVKPSFMHRRIFKIIGKCTRNKKQSKRPSSTSSGTNRRRKTSGKIKRDLALDFSSSSEKCVSSEIDIEDEPVPNISPRIRKTIIVPMQFDQNIDDKIPFEPHDFEPSDNEKEVEPSTSSDFDKQEDVKERISEIEKEKCSVMYSSTCPYSNSLPISKFGQLRAIEIQEIKNLLCAFRESEVNIKVMLAKYIKDKSKEEELFQAIYKHGKTYSEAERRAHTVATKMWERKSHESVQLEKSHKDIIQALTKENRKLHTQIEQLKSKQEHLSFSGSSTEHRLVALPNVKLKKNNDFLRSKIFSMSRQLECLETQLQTSKVTIEHLQAELTRVTSESEQQKEQIRKLNTDHELEETSLLNQLSSSEKIIKECVDAGDILVDDLDSLQRQLKKFPITLNLTKLKGQGSSLVELINLSRLWANETTRELLNIFSQKELLEKDNKFALSEVSRLKEELKVCSAERNNFRDKIEELSAALQEHKELVEKVPIYESELRKYKNDLSGKENQLKDERSYAIVASENINELTKTITNKEITISHLHKSLQELKNECSLLKSQVDHNKKVMDKSYISALMKQLTEAQDKIMYYQKHFSEYEAAKSNYLELAKQFSDERAKLVQNQHALYEQLQEKHIELTKLTSENIELKGKFLKQQSLLF